MQGKAESGSVHLLSPVTGQWHVLEGTARRIWELLDYPLTADDLVAALAAEYEAPDARIAEAVASTLASLEDCGLVAEAAGRAPAPMRDRYLRLLKHALANTLYPELEMQLLFLARRDHGLSGLDLARQLRDIGQREPEWLSGIMAGKQQGLGPYRYAHTMIGLFRLANIERCAEQVLADGIEGDFLEAGVCRGGATIFMRGLQIAHGAADRRTWVVDSFQGLPPSVTEEDLRHGVHLDESIAPWAACSEEAVRENFSRYDLLDGNVHFVRGWLAESLPGAPIGPLAILRLDVDLYSSTMEALDLLYDKLSPGGFLIVDDYGFFECCREAVDDFRARRGIEEPIQWVDYSGIYWRKSPGGGD